MLLMISLRPVAWFLIGNLPARSSSIVDRAVAEVSSEWGAFPSTVKEVAASSSESEIFTSTGAVDSTAVPSKARNPGAVV
jgi:hypothetical protein